MENKSWFYYYDSAQYHIVLVIRDKISTHIVPQPLYLPDLAPYDVQLLKLKRPIWGSLFDTIKEIKTESKVLKAILYWKNTFLPFFLITEVY